MRKNRIWLGVAGATFCLALFGAGTARADEPKFRRVAEFEAKGEAKEVAAVQEAHYCMIRVMTGTVIINTIVVREGGKKTPFTVSKELKADDKHVVDFGERRNITGLRISDGGGGTYRVYLKR